MNVLLIIFNRPTLTNKVFEQVRKSRPEKLYIAADGPRVNKIGEKLLCDESRKISQMIDWPCEIKTRFQEKNLGCKLHVSSAITWFFENVTEGIILEDDCLPVQSFFIFCSQMLEKYRANEHIMHINGSNFLDTSFISNRSFDYHFSRCVHVWGWASWRRAWNKYDLNMSHIDSLRQSNDPDRLFLKKKHLHYWKRLFKHINSNNIDTWDAQWQYSVLYNSGIVVSPNINMIKNIGFGIDATHTSLDTKYPVHVDEMPANLRYPQSIDIDVTADDKLMTIVYERSIVKKIASKILSLIT